MRESAASFKSASSRIPDLDLISDLVFTNTTLGRGADASVYKAEWNGTLCAAKRLHEILLEDDSPGGRERLVRNFAIECVTWSKLRHPNIVQFLGVYLERGSLLPVLVLEKMDTSLRRYLEGHRKEKFPLGTKAFVLHQITQALAYLHNQKRPLVHRDLSTNNVLLNEDTFVTKISDFGMSRAISPSAISRKSSIKGTPAFMPPEALQTPPQYNEKLDVFSFGNVILSTITHEWPQPCHLTQYKGDQLIALDEFQRRERYVEMFTAQEKLFLPIVHRCLENRPDKRPSSVMLVQELRHILQSGDHGAPIVRLRQQLTAKEEECRQKDEVIKEKDEELRKANESLWKNEQVLKGKNEVISGHNRALQYQEIKLCEQAESLQKQDSTIRAQKAEIECLRNQLLVAQKVS